MDRLGEFFSSLKPKADDDSYDRLNYYYTVLLLLAFAITIGYKGAVGEPLQCWVPAEFPGFWEQYAEQYCFVENTYWVHMNNTLPLKISDRDKKEIHYYQWVPFFLALQALMFYLPHIVWQALNWQSGLTISELISMATDLKNINESDRKTTVTTVVQQIKLSNRLQKTKNRDNEFGETVQSIGRSKGYYMTGVYLFTKVLYLVNLFCQFAILNAFIGSKYTFWGISILKDMARGVTWEETGHFPRVTMCDFVIRDLGNLRRFSIQCVLMINMFIEKVYLFVWFWLLLVTVLTIGNFLWWLSAVFIKGVRINFIERYIHASDQSAHLDKTQLKRFVRSYLRSDGVFVLRLIASNAGDMMTTDIIRELWSDFKANQPEEVPFPSYPTTEPGQAGPLPDKKLMYDQSSPLPVRLHKKAFDEYKPH